MIRLFLIASLLWGAFVYAAPVEIQVQNVTKSTGSIIISLFAQPQDWDKEVPSTTFKIAPVVLGTSKLVVDLPPGEYAFFLFDDVNNNGQLEKSVFGLPAEPYAFSNNVHIKFSKPAWKDLKFSVSDAGATEAVTLVVP